MLRLGSWKRRAHGHDGSAIFDYVVVGGGSAGCVLANRLSEDRALSVCLIEAGPADSHPLVHVPLGLAALFNHRKLNWRYRTTAQAHAAGRRIHTPRGKVLGGTGSINGMVYMRGHPSDYDAWAALGNRGWSFAEVLPYFLRSEDNEAWRDSPFHGTSGPMRVSDTRHRNPSAERFLSAAALLQFPRCPDFNGPSPEGFGYRQLTQRNGRRESTATAFLRPIQSRNNLVVVTEALAERIIFEGRRATGVRYRLGAEARVVHARREVILAAGAIASPHLLQLSGIGDGAKLSEHGIDVLHHQPSVGCNLQDHPAVAQSYVTDNTEPLGLSIRAVPKLAGSLVEYALRRGGLLSSNVVEAAGYIRLAPTSARPDVQFSFMSAKRGGGSGSSAQFGYGHGYGLTTVLLHPYSRGSVTLASSRPTDPPSIDPCYAQDERDVKTLVQGIELGRRILASEPFQDYAATEIAPGPAVRTEAELEDYVRRTVGTAFHPVGTCGMGPGDDAVVTPDLRVRGVDGLRVADASVMPAITGGNTNAPTIMVAEKAVDFVLGRPAPPPVRFEA